MIIICTILFLFASWSILASVIANPLILPPLGDVAQAALSFCLSPAFYQALAMSLVRAAVAIVLALLIAAALLALGYLYPRLRAAAELVLGIVKTTPTIALILLLNLWLSPRLAPIVVAVLVLLPLLYLHLAELKGLITAEVKEMLHLYKVSRRHIITEVYLPLVKAPLRRIISYILPLAFKLVIAAEVLASTQASIGNLMHNEQIWLNSEGLMALAVLTVAVGVLLERLFKPS